MPNLIGHAPEQVPTNSMLGKFAFMNQLDTDSVEITTAGTTGDRTINRLAGTVNFANGASQVVVTNARVKATSLVFVQVMTDTGGLSLLRVIVNGAGGSFTIKSSTAATVETKVGFVVFPG